jgi:two-component system, cell cycle sensor histidine kinase and response regulator CckA
MSSLVLLKVLLFVEAGFTGFLVAVLIAIRPYFRSQTFFCRWMWAWMAHAAFLVVGLWPIAADWGTPLLRSLCLFASEILGMLFVPLLIAGAEAFRNSGHDAKVARIGTVAALVGAVFVYMLSMLVGGNAQLSFGIRSVPMQIAACAALWYCTYVFYCSWRRTDSGGSLLAMLASGSCGAMQMVFALLTARGSVLGVRWIALDTLCQASIAIATMLLILEEQAVTASAVRDSEQRYRLLFERNLAGVFRSGVDGTLIDCNEALCTMLGYDSREELQRVGMRSLYVDPEERNSAIAKLRSHGQLINHEVRWRRKDGTEIVALANVALLSEAPAVLEGTVLDVSEVRRLQSHLLQAEKMEAVGSLAGGVAHDFNNLLMIITAYCELLAEGLSDAEQREQVESALKACWKAADLTKQLLAFSRRQPIAPQVLDMNQVVREMSGMLRRLINENIDLQIEVEQSPVYCRADATHLQQVLMNLCANARDAMPEGGRLLIRSSSLWVNAEQAEKLAPLVAGEYAVLTVSDSGSGIDPATRQRIFEPFFTTKGIGRGTGLGLSTVYGVVKQNEGFIFVESEMGCGTTFKVYLPRVQAAVETVASPRKETRSPAQATILLVEDELPLRDAGAEYLRACGYKVYTASSGEEAMAIAHGTPISIDLLVTDVIMPGMTGAELADQLCSLRPNVRVVYMSGYPSDSPVHQKVGGMQGIYLQKPFSFHLLSTKLEELLSNGGALAQSG